MVLLLVNDNKPGNHVRIDQNDQSDLAILEQSEI